MKSNKQRYKESLNKAGSPSSGKSDGGLMLVLFVVLMIVLFGLHQAGLLLNGSDTGTEGIGNAIPDAEEIGKRFR